MGGLKLLVRFEANYADASSDNSSIETLVSSINQVDLNNNNLVEKKFEHSRLSFIQSGVFRPEQKSVEMATKSLSRNQFPVTKWDLLYFAKGDRLLIGWHNKGMLQKIERLTFETLTVRCNRTKSSIKSVMSKLSHLLVKLKAFALDQPDNDDMYSVIFENNQSNNTVKIYKCIESKQCLPSHYMKQLFF